ncbi:zinc finger protein 532-like [Antedon mediterranea]|uniref:zinc finger protein 532-like n=1 Tax=Antedon mediterranea TaxID=105859 RepID=UPI003AF91C97
MEADSSNKVSSSSTTLPPDGLLNSYDNQANRREEGQAGNGISDHSKMNSCMLERESNMTAIQTSVEGRNSNETLPKSNQITHKTIEGSGTVPISVSAVQALNKPPTGQLSIASSAPMFIKPLIKVPEIGKVSSASHTLALISENVVKTISSVGSVQAAANSTRPTSTIAPRNSKSRKLSYKFISSAAQKTSNSNRDAGEINLTDLIKTTSFELNSQWYSVNSGGLSNLFKSGPKHVVKEVPERFVDRLTGSPFKCLGCGDSYTLKSSLQMHVNRCSSLIKYKCPYCNITKTFYNKCSLFIHARDHARVTKKPFELRANLANLSVIPVQEMNFFNRGEHNVEDGQTKKMIMETQEKVIQPKDSVGELSKTKDKVSDRSQEYVKDGMKMCLICMERFTALNTKANHFKRETKRVVCQLCDQILFNPCMAELHKNFHLHRQPLQCPDCGLVSDTEREAYRHIQQSCFHMARKILVRCSVCNIYVSSFKVYQNHLIDRHAESFFKCVECQLAYRSVESLKCHTVVEHKNSKNSSMCNIILKCPLCETVFGNKKQLTAHIQSTHTYSDLSEVKVVHECSHCGKLFQQLSSLDTHMLLTHKNCAGHFHCEFCNRAVQFCDLAIHKKHCSLKLHSKVKSSEDVGALMSKDGEGSGKSQVDNHDNANTNDIADVFVCLHCSKDGKNMVFKSKQDLDTHYLMLKHKEAVLKNAIDMTRAGHDLTDSKRKSDSQDDVVPLKKLKIILPRKDFRCGLCDFKCSARDEFKNHLAEKHEATSEHQCQECGLSFRAAFSLKMHLRAVHKIYDLGQYLNEKSPDVQEIAPNEENAEKKIKLKPSPAAHIVNKYDINSMECQVCYKVFDTEINLKTHMRNHGMAFIKSKRKMSLDGKDGNKSF